MVTHILERGDGDQTVRVAVSEFGAHIQAWDCVRSKCVRKVLFLSSKAVLDGSKAIRGGVPICWPWFGPSKNPLSTLQHGFARISTWRTVDKHDDRVTLELTDCDVDPALLAGFSGFRVRYTVEIAGDDALRLHLAVENTGEKDLPPMTTALHSYFQLASESAEVHLNAKDVAYIDQLGGPERLINSEGVISTFGKEETDLVCLNVPSTIDIVDKVSSTKLELQSEGLPDAVLWNPYVNKAASMADFGDDEWRDMICVESARIEHPAIVEPGCTWHCSVTIRIVQ